MRILYFDVASIIILLILMISLVIRNMLDGRVNRLLALVFFQGFLTAIIDLWAESYTVWIPVTEDNSGIRYLTSHIYFIFRNMTPFLYQMFLFAVTDTWHLWTKKKWVKCVLIIPYIIVCVTVISNPFNHMMFYYDENLVYYRGPLIYVLYAVSMFYCIFGVVFLIVYKKMLTTEKFVALIAMYPFNLVAVMLQLFFIQLLIEMFMTSLSFLLLTAVVQRPEENVNPAVGTRSLIAYTTDMRKAYYISKPVQIILVKIANYKSIAGILDIESCYLLMKKLAEKMMKAKSEERLPMDVYYLENGLFSLVTEKDQPDKLRTVAEQISGILSRVTEFEKLDIELNSCICIIRCPEDIDDYEKLISFGNTFHTYLPLGGVVNDMSEPKERRKLNLRNDLDGIISDAIVNKRFEMYYQPIYSINEKRFLSAEALIRLNDETYGFISPELFITAAEKSGMILQIGEYVLDSVCCFLERCGKEGLPVDYIELNLSMSQCMQRELPDKVLYYLNKYNLRPDQVNLEITETAANTAQDVVEENIISLSKKGIYFSLDDYGTGYSNLGRIMELPFHIVKLDKSLADRVGNPRMKILLKNTIHMIKEMGMEIVVEGVETKETLQQFEELGCDFIQGYYFSKPLPEEKYIEFIRQSQN